MAAKPNFIRLFGVTLKYLKNGMAYNNLYYYIFSNYLNISWKNIIFFLYKWNSNVDSKFKLHYGMRRAFCFFRHSVCMRLYMQLAIIYSDGVKLALI